ncbi:MAG: prepilin peptidase [Ilumatobacteraceae bacterium]
MGTGGVTGGLAGAAGGGPAGWTTGGKREPLTVRWEQAWWAVPPGRRRWFAGALASCPLVAAGATAAGATAAGGTSVAAGAAITATGTAIAVAALIDAHEHRLPNALTAMAAALALLGAALSPGGQRILPALLGGAIAGLAMLTVHLTRGVGLGDVKLAAAIGLSTGSLALIAAPLAIAVAAAGAAASGFVTGRRRLPLGPALWAGWAVGAMAGALAGGGVGPFHGGAS